MSIKVRLAKLEASIPILQEKRFIFMTRAEHDNSEIIAFKYKEEIIRTENETFEDFQSRAETFSLNIIQRQQFLLSSVFMNSMFKVSPQM